MNRHNMSITQGLVTAAEMVYLSQHNGSNFTSIAPFEAPFQESI